MFNNNNKNEDRPTRGVDFMMAISIDASLAFNKLATELINKYKANGVDVVPISELENCQRQSLEQSLGKGSLIEHLMKGK